MNVEPQNKERRVVKDSKIEIPCSIFEIYG